MDFAYQSAGPTLRIVMLVMLFVLALAALGVVVFLAALPGLTAKRRRHPQAPAVNVCGWLGLPTGIGWVVAMVWAYWRFDALAPDLPALGAHFDRLESAVATLERRAEGAA